jgi:M-phase inducer tyrosine phosphatase
MSQGVLLLPEDPLPPIDPEGLRLLMSDTASYGYDVLLIADARFEYEYTGGHIEGSLNVRSVAQMKDLFDEFRECSACVVFHCEFSKNRGPTLMHAFRDHDRRKNYYPHLDFPDIFLLDGGYKRFYDESRDLCTGGYVPMREQSFVASGELRRSHSLYSRDLQLDGKKKMRLRRAHSDSEATECELTDEPWLRPRQLSPHLFALGGSP